MRSPIPLLLLASLCAACVLPPFALEGKECDQQEPCPEGFFCAPRVGTPRGVCSAVEPSCPGAELGATCRIGEGACLREGTLICTLAGAACSELPGAPAEEACNGIDDDCDGVVDDSSGCIHSLAGAGPPGFADGAPEQARFGGPGFITVAANGDLLVADTYAHALRRVDASGAVTTLAGVGRCGFLDGPALEAALCLPGEVVEAADGTLYFSDSGNARLRALSTGGVVTTVAGTGERGTTDGPALSSLLDWPIGLHAMDDGSVMIADRDAHRLRRYTPGASPTLSTVAGKGEAGYLDGSREQLLLDQPVDVVSPGGDGVYVSEAHLVRRLPEGGSSALVAGWNTPGFADNVFAPSVRFHRPMQLALSGGQLLVADALNHRLRVIDLGGGATASPTGGTAGFTNGAAAAAALRLPHGIATVGTDTWAFLDGNARLRKLSGDLITNLTADFSGGSWQRQAADGEAADARLSSPVGLALTSGEWWWVEPGPSLVRRLRPDGTVQTVAGLAEAPGSTGYVNGAFADARVRSPSALAAGPDGRILVSDRFNHAIRVFDPASGQVSTLAGPLTPSADLVNGTLGQARFSQPTALWAEPDGTLFVYDSGNAVIRRIDPAGDAVSTFAGSVGTHGSTDGAVGTGELGAVSDLCSDGAGGLWILEDRRRLRRAAPDGTLSTPLPLLTFDAQVLRRDLDGSLLLAGGEQLYRVTPADGAATRLFPTAANRAPVGFVDGTVDTAAAFEISGLFPTADAIYFVDLRANRLRQLWR